jgi:hypothetical protein
VGPDDGALSRRAGFTREWRGILVGEPVEEEEGCAIWISGEHKVKICTGGGLGYVDRILLWVFRQPMLCERRVFNNCGLGLKFVWGVGINSRIQLRLKFWVAANGM